MTAEVAILNHNAVAVAADSAITVPSRNTIYYTASKIFSLSLRDPVAIMIYGTATFGSIPWESIVKIYRQSEAKSRGTVHEYAASFIEYLSSIADRMSKKSQHEFIRHVARQEIYQAFYYAVWDPGQLGIRKNILNQVHKRTHTLSQVDKIVDLEESVVGQEIQDAIPDWEKFVDQCCLNLISTDKSVGSATKKMVKTALMATHQSWSTGLVVTGFGVDQWFPSLSHYTLDCILADQIWSRCLGQIQISDQNRSAIYPYAQAAMIQSFIQGIHPNSHSAIINCVSQLIERLAQHVNQSMHSLSISGSVRKSLMDELNSAKSFLLDDSREKIDQILKRYSTPIYSTIASLPKEKMASIAEDLVNIASLGLQMASQDEIVGGPIDVAVISKGDGLVWVKSKHDFPLESDHNTLARK